VAIPRWKQRRVEWVRAHERELRLLVLRMTPAELRALSRDEAVGKLLAVVEAWEAVTGRSQDLPRERLEEETTSTVKAHLAWYCSDEARALLAEVLVDLVQQVV